MSGVDLEDANYPFLGERNSSLRPRSEGKFSRQEEDKAAWYARVANVASEVYAYYETRAFRMNLSASYDSGDTWGSMVSTMTVTMAMIKPKAVDPITYVAKQR